MTLSELAGLQSPDPAAQGRALDAAQAIWWGPPGTSPRIAAVVREIAEALGRGHLDAEVQSELLDLLGEIAGSAIGPPDDASGALRDVLPVIVDLLDSEPGPVLVPVEGGHRTLPPWDDTRIGAAVAIVRLGGVDASRTRFIALLRGWVAVPRPGREGWARVLVLVGDDVSDLLHHPDVAVRVAVAYLTDHPDQARELRAWLSQPEPPESSILSDALLVARLVQVEGDSTESRLVERAISRETNPSSAKEYLGSVFPEPWDGVSALSGLQRTVLAAMVERGLFWGTELGSVYGSFLSAGLRDDRAATARLVSSKVLLLPSDVAGPLTQTVGLFRASHTAIAEWYATGHPTASLSVPEWRTLADVAAGMRRAAGGPAAVFIPWGAWTLMLDSGEEGRAAMGHTAARVAEMFSCRAIAARAVDETDGPPPARILEVYTPAGAGGPPVACRVVSVVRDADEWQFADGGDPFDFELVGTYTARLTDLRLTSDRLRSYLHALGVPENTEPAWVEAVCVRR